ncbi:MAG: alpha/beta hydrolase fold domain-containing protein [Ignavibacteriae bacterium]|nr:alpha/beta hydrolase fold domain-containing protein [Ignavibacteriota bacterium]
MKLRYYKIFLPLVCVLFFGFVHAQTTITSDITGNWNSPATWIGGVVPGATDNVVISVGDTVTIDIATASCANLTVRGTVFFLNDGTSTGITVNGNIDVQSGGVVRARARSVAVLYSTTPTTHALTLYGNLTNAGTFDMREGANGSSGQTNQTIRICNAIFAGSSNSTISLRYTAYQSSGEEFNSVTINKTGGAKVILASGNLFMNNNSSVGACLLTFTSGLIETGPTSIWVHLPTASGSLVGASTSRYVKGALGRGLNSSQGTDRKLEIGDEDGYRPISVRSTAGSGSGHYVSARLIKGNANTGNSTLTGGIDSVSRYRYYQIGYARGGSGAASMTFDEFTPSYKSDDGVEEGMSGVMVAYSTDNRLTWANAGPGNHVIDLSDPPTPLQSGALSAPISIGDGGTYHVCLAWGPPSGTGIIPDIANRSYGPYPLNKFDMWKAPSSTPTPLVIWIHGGGLKSGSKADVSSVLIERLLAQGISVMSINYRLTPEAIFPMHFMDCARALQYARFHATELNIDPARIGLGGSSAGALTSFWLGFHNDLADPTNADSVLRMSTRVRALACWSGQTSLDRRVIPAWVGSIVLTYNTYFDGQMFGIPADSIDTPTGYALQEAISPVNYVTPDDPPVWMYYSQVNPATTSSEAIHHVGFGINLKTKVDSAGLFCSLLTPSYSGSVTDSAVAFYVKYVKNAIMSVNEQNVASEFFLRQNYPNPFNPTTTISYSLGDRSLVSLKVYDVLGREVATLVDEIQDSGFKSVRFDARLPDGQASGLASGVYIYRLQAGDFLKTNRMLLVK